MKKDVGITVVTPTGRHLSSFQIRNGQCLNYMHATIDHKTIEINARRDLAVSELSPTAVNEFDITPGPATPIAPQISHPDMLKYPKSAIFYIS
ncbi:hypothetical protein MY10362_005302 [Beauveria mimosiformis]